MSEKSIREIAAELGVSKTAIRKRIDNLGLRSSLRLIGNQFAIDEAAEKLIVASFKGSHTPQETETSSRSETETSSRSETEKFAFWEQELTRRDDEITRLHSEIETMHAEIQRLQDAAARSTEVISELTQSITALSKNLAASQILHGADLERLTTQDEKVPAADPVQDQTEAAADPGEEQHDERPQRSFWKRFFGLE